MPQGRDWGGQESCRFRSFSVAPIYAAAVDEIDPKCVEFVEEIASRHAIVIDDNLRFPCNAISYRIV